MSQRIVDALLERARLDPRVSVVEPLKPGPYVRLSHGGLLTVGDNAALVSRDNGETWGRGRKMYSGPGPGVPGGGGVMARTREGVLVYVYQDMKTFKWSWSKAKKEARESVCNVWAIRSTNEGKSWSGRRQLLEGYCGALIDMIATSTGEIVVPVQLMLEDPSRHAIRVHVSDDGGKSWYRSNIIDLGGHGHHDGAMEPTLVELKDGRLWMLMRTNLDEFWEAFSADKGRSWRVIQPSGIDASTAPGYMLRLHSGRLALVWNRLYPKGKKSYRRRPGDCQYHAVDAVWHREELSLSFSRDEGASWSEPTVIIRIKGGDPCYPYVFERDPGYLWVTTRFGEKWSLSLRESDFV